jgi:hypothetical protein
LLDVLSTVLKMNQIPQFNYPSNNPLEEEYKMKKMSALVVMVLAFLMGMALVPAAYGQSAIDPAMAAAVAQTCAKFDGETGLCKDPQATTAPDATLSMVVAQTCTKFDGETGLCVSQTGTGSDPAMAPVIAQTCTKFDGESGLCLDK